MNPVNISFSLATANAAIIAASQTPVSGTALTLVGGGTVTLDAARRMLLTYGNEGSARTLTIAGTDRFGNVQSEILAVPSGASGSVYTNRDFLTVTSALPLGGGWTAAVTVGTNAIGSTQWFVREWGQLGKLGVFFNIGSTAVTGNFEITPDDPEAALDIYPGGVSVEPKSNVPPIPYIPVGWSAVAASQTSEVDIPCYAFRATILSGTGVLQMQVIETTGDRKNAF